MTPARVLVVDDSLTVRMDLAEAIEAAGLTAVPCATLAEARRALRDGTVELVLLDVNLPDGDGVELLRELRGAPDTAALPIVMLSSEAEVKDRIRGLATGASDYIGKPYDRTALIGRIRQLLAVRRDAILVIDDSATYRNALAARLVEAGYDTLVAADGAEGLRVAAVHRPAAIIVDGMMPGMDGTAVIRRIRLDPELRATPCLMLTATLGRDAEVQALEAGADAFVRKEDDVAVILARLAVLLRASPHREPAPATHRRVLAADDNPMYLEILAEVLRGDGYDVVLASSGEEAIELLAVQPVDCILMDRSMPGLSGAETCRRIKSAPRIRDTPLIMVTASEGRDAMIDGFSAGADDFISKSAGSDVLRARIHAQIRRKQVEDEHRAARDRILTIELEARAARELAEARREMAEELARTNAKLLTSNRDLAAFAYSVSRDLRAPLRAIHGFSQALVEDLADELDGDSRGLLDRIVGAASRMEEQIEALISLARVTEEPMELSAVPFSELCREVLDELARSGPARHVECVVAPGLTIRGDARMLRLVAEHLLGNAWKFTSRRDHARIEVGADTINGERVFYVRDNGIGFDMAFAANLWSPFQRQHSASEFPGTGIGLATVQRIVQQHGGRIWADAARDRGATFSFTIP